MPQGVYLPLVATIVRARQSWRLVTVLTVLLLLTSTLLVSAQSPDNAAAQDGDAAVGEGGATGAAGILAFDDPDNFTLAGRLGVGTETPAFVVDARENRNGVSRLRLLNNNGGANTTADLYVHTAGTGQGIALTKFGAGYTGVWSGQPLANRAWLRTDTNVTGLILATGGNAPLLFGANNVERMRIAPDGNVGIGTTTPYRPLEVVTGNAGVANHLIAFGTTADNGKGSLFGVDTTNRKMYWRLNDSGDYGWQFQNAQGAPTFSVLNNGDTVTYRNIHMDSNYVLGVSGGGAFTFPYAGHNMGGLALGWFKPNNTGRGQMWLSGQDGMVFFTNGDGANPRLAITVDGKVGIGNPNPTHALQVNGPSVYFTGDLNVDGASNLGSTLRIKNAGVAQPYEITGDVAGLKFFTQGTQRLALTPSGNFDINAGTRFGPSADDGFGFDYRNQRMTGNALSWVQPSPSTTSTEMWLSGKNGMTFFTNNNPRMVVQANGNVGINTAAPVAHLDVAGTTRTDVLVIDGGADLAEPFEITGADTIEPGMVVAIDPENPGQLRLATSAYDRTVAGVVSGAGGINPGLILQQEGSIAVGDHPVALTGRVYVYADAGNGPIVPGDLLTTADTPGHAMKVTDYARAQGAILGKAMSKLEDGTGLVLVLVTLQ